MAAGTTLTQETWDGDPRYDAFAREYVFGNNANNASACYRKVFGASVAESHKRGCVMRRRPMMRKAIASYRAELIERWGLTREDCMQRVETLRRRAINQKDVNAALRAEEMLIKMCGYFVDHTEITIKPDLAAMKAELAQLLQADSALAGEVRSALPATDVAGLIGTGRLSDTADAQPVEVG